MTRGDEDNSTYRLRPATRLIIAALIPLLAFTLQWLFWKSIQPYVWFLFYPAIFMSSWIGGMRAGLAATVFSAFAVWWFFIPTRFSFVLERPTSLLAIGIFACMGTLFSLTHARLRKANQQTVQALAAVKAANAHLEERVRERTAELAGSFEALRESEAKYRHTLDVMLEGCQIIGFDWRYLYVNDTAEKHNRHPKAELLGRTVMECWPGITETKVFALEQSCMEARSTHRLNNEFVFPDGSHGWFRLIIQPVAEGIAIYSEDITERKRAEEAVRLAHERLRSFVDANIVGIVLAEPSGKVVEANDYYLRTIGYTREEFEQGMVDWRAITPPEWLPADERALRELRERGACQPYEKEYLRRDGSRVSVFLADALLPGEEDQIAAFALDITERKQAEEALRESEERLRLFIEHAPAGLAMFDREMRYLYASRRWLSDYSLGIRDLRGLSHYDLFPELPEKWREAHRKGLAGEVLRAEADRFERADGLVQWIRWEIRPWYDKMNSIGGIVIFTEDITEHKNAEDEVITLNDRLQHLISAIKELASARDLESIQRMVSVSARRLTGADGATIVFREGDCCYYADEDAIAPLWKGKRFPLTDCISGWVMLNGTPALITDIYADDRIPFEAYRPTFVKSLAMFPVNTDQPVAAIGNYWSDNHNPSEIEIQLLQTLADAAARAVENVRILKELEQRVQERTAQLEAVNRELEAFSYSVSHDLKAPLRGIDGYSRLLEEDHMERFAPEGRQFVRNIRQGAAQMHELIDDLLNYSRLERRTLQSVPIDLSTLLQAVLAERADEVAQSGAVLDVEVPGISVRADREGLAMVLRNLLENALKFTRDASPPTIEIKARIEDTMAILSIRDNGIGFDMKFHDRIFDIFQRLQRSEDYPGTGVGLALVRKAMQRMGGTVRAESSPGKGATFTLEIPV
jgi:PAS domain S-box-containing protein